MGIVLVALLLGSWTSSESDAPEISAPCQYQAHMRPILAAVKREIRAAPSSTLAQVQRRSEHVLLRTTKVDVAYGSELQSEEIRSLLFAAVTDVEQAVDLWHRRRDPETSNAWLDEALSSLRQARQLVRQVACADHTFF